MCERDVGEDVGYSRNVEIAAGLLSAFSPLTTFKVRQQSRGEGKQPARTSSPCQGEQMIKVALFYLPPSSNTRDSLETSSCHTDSVYLVI